MWRMEARRIVAAVKVSTLGRTEQALAALAASLYRQNRLC